MNSKTCRAFVVLAVLALLVALPTCAQTTPCTENVQQPEQIAAPAEQTQETIPDTEPVETPQEPTPDTAPAETTLEPAPDTTSAETTQEPIPDITPSSAVTLDQVLDNMEAARKKLTTFQATVIKTKETKILDKVEKATGSLQFKMPRLLRMELKSVPKGQTTITIVGETYAWVYREYKQQATRATLKDFEKQSKDANPLEYGLTRDIHELTNAYTLKLLPEEKVDKALALPIELTPIGARHATDGTLIFWIDKTLWLPVQVREHKSSGETIETHTFSGIKLNKRIKNSTFQFKPPKDVEQFIN